MSEKNENEVERCEAKRKKIKRKKGNKIAFC